VDGSVTLTTEALLQQLPEFHTASAMDCGVCAAALAQAAQGHHEVQAAVEGQRAALSKLLATGVTEVLEEGRGYYLVPK
jgi:predicted aspartyl protease